MPRFWGSLIGVPVKFNLVSKHAELVIAELESNFSQSLILSEFLRRT